MNGYRRDLFLKVHRGAKSNLPYLYWIDHHAHADRILEFLLRTGMTGETLTAYVQDKCHGQPIRFFARITKAMLNVNNAPKLLKGINFR